MGMLKYSILTSETLIVEFNRPTLVYINVQVLDAHIFFYSVICPRLRQTDQVSLAGLLQSHHSGALETQVSFEVLGDFPHQALERQLTNKQLGGLLITTDLSQSHGPGPVTMGLAQSYGRLWW